MLPEPRTDKESIDLADVFMRLERHDDFQVFKRELEREQGLLTEQLLEGRAESYDSYLEVRGAWQGLSLALRLAGIVVEEAIQVGEQENDVDG